MSTLDEIASVVLEVLPEVLRDVPLEDALKIAQKSEFRQGLKTLFLELWETRPPGEPFTITYHPIKMKRKE